MGICRALDWDMNNGKAFLSLCAMSPISPANVVHVESSGSVECVQNHLANAGHISRLYPWRLDRSKREHYFIIFSSTKEADRAVQLSASDVVVHPLARAPQQLIDKFNAVVHGPFNDPSASPDTTRNTPSVSLTPRYTSVSSDELDSDSQSAPPKAATATGPGPVVAKSETKTRAAKRAKLLKHAMHTELAFDALRAPSPATFGLPGPSSSLGRPSSYASGVPYISLSNRLSREDQQGSMNGIPGRSRTPPALISPPPSPIPVDLGSAKSSRGPAANSSSVLYIPSRAPPIRVSMVLMLCGQSISIGLDDLDEDPQAVISLLKVAEADKDKWILVAGAYRRRGNMNAAITVVDKMLEVMKDAGVPEDLLKPAFLLLSSCLTELGKQARSSNGMATLESSTCFEQSRYWLQKVYGPLKPELAPQHTFSGIPSSVGRPRTGSSSNGPSGPRATDLSPPSSSDQRALERELMVLRDRHTSFISELTDARAAKRKSEDEYIHERSHRRKLEGHIEDLERQLSKAEKRMDSALDQVKREVEARRRAEDKAEEEKKLRIENEKTARARAQEQVVKPFFEELAGIFTKAARGEVALGAFTDSTTEMFGRRLGSTGEGSMRL